MVDAIRRASEEGQRRLLVVTGGFHSSALAARLDGLACLGIETPDSAPPPVLGIALTSYSYERLDNLIGYNAGMPSPGFYEHTWRQRQQREPFSHQPLLADLVQELRHRKQTLSTADLIAVETSARRSRRCAGAGMSGGATFSMP